ncbi:MAG: PAS domain S-box protein [Beijerinckiaceae bacterium]|nr:PAS domain S-box protein [Beijerinckiaceae bacterium]
MSGARQDWARIGVAAAQDAGLAGFAAGGALLIWDADSRKAGYANAAGLALLGRDGLDAELPPATRQRFGALAGGLASREGVRLERLRLTSGFTATPVTCGCRLFDGGDGQAVLAIAVPAAEMRRLGVAVPAPESAETEIAAQTSIAEPETVAAPAAEPVPAAPARALVRFLWQSDAAGHLISVSPDVAALTGRDAAAALPGRSWRDLLETDVVDRDGGLLDRLAGRATWRGHGVLWRTGSGAEGARVELSGVPVLDAARQVSGFRGFGLARLTEREPFPAHEPAAPQADPADQDAVPEIAGEDLAALGVSPPDVAEPADAVRADQTQAPAEAETGEQAEADEVVTATAQPAIEVETPDEAEPTEIQSDIAEVTAAATDETVSDAADQPVPGDEATASEAQEPVPVIDEPAAAKAEAAAEEPAPPVVEAPPRPDITNIVPLRNGHLTAVRPVLEPSKPNLSSAERNAFREIAKALGARIAGDDEPSPRLPQAAPLRLKDSEPLAPAPVPAESASAPAVETPAVAPASAAPAPEALGDDAMALDATAPSALQPARQRLPNSHADVLDRLPVAVLVNRGDEALYANRTLLDLLDYADLADLAAGGSVSRLIKGANRADGGAMILIDRLGHLVSVDAVLSSVSWLGEPATLMAFRHPDGGGEVKVQTPEEAEEAELAAEFEAEEAESAARVQALRLDVDQRESRIDELVAMLDTATDGVVTVDERGRMLSLNKTAEALFGYDQREVTGELFTLLFAPESHAPALDYLEGLKGGGVASVMNDGREVIGRVRQGGRIPLFMTMGQIAHGAERRFCAVLRDITAWKKTESDLVEARKAAEKASAQKSDVLAKISHEIRTPLNAIIGFAEVMAEERFGPIANERYKEYLRDIHASGGYVISLVNDLLDLAKIEAGKLDLDFESVNLNEIALSTVSLLQTEANRGRVVLRSGLSPKLPPVVADQRSIKQIVINLLSNAVKFTDAGGQVIVSTALGDQGEAILRVRDTGIGMDDHEIALALEPFRQVPTTRRKGGTGLGLPLTKALVEANRAAMTITSVKKEGTLVEITFPPQRVLAG